MKVLFLTAGSQVPSSRFRVLQFLEPFSARGVECTVRSAYGDRYNDYLDRPWSAAYKLLSRAKRAAHTLDGGQFDIIFLQRTSFPYTALPEVVVSRFNSRIIFDYDDAIFLGPSGRHSWSRRRTFDQVVRVSAHVVAGNGYLAERARAPEKTSVIPTVIDTYRYRPLKAAKRPDGSVVVGWMGTSSNFRYLEAIVPELLDALDQLPTARLRIVSNASFAPLLGHPRVEHARWSEDQELNDLRSFDIGLMPLVDDRWTRGKCGFKMIQYMAVGVPVIASAVGANREIFRGSGAGYLVDAPGQWAEALRRLAGEPALRQAQGQAGREHVCRSYSIESVIDRYLEIFAAVAAAPGTTAR